MDLALQCDKISKIIVVSDIDIPNKNRKIIVDKEPSSLAGDDVPIKAVTEYIRKKYEIKTPIILLQPSCPLRTIEQLNEAIYQFIHYDKNIIPMDFYKKEPNGSVFVFKGSDPWEFPFHFYYMKDMLIDIDYEYQFKIAEWLMIERLEKLAAK